MEIWENDNVQERFAALMAQWSRPPWGFGYWQIPSRPHFPAQALRPLRPSTPAGCLPRTRTMRSALLVAAPAFSRPGGGPRCNPPSTSRGLGRALGDVHFERALRLDGPWLNSSTTESEASARGCTSWKKVGARHQLKPKEAASANVSRRHYDSDPELMVAGCCKATCQKLP